jgi:hypothetical protein
MQTSGTALELKQPPASVTDSGSVRLGGFWPSLPPARPTPAIADSGKVRLGGFFPSL